jgi:lipid-binding SYLF domain-containing protein
MRLTLTTALLAGLLTIPEVLLGCGSVPTTQSGMNAKMETVVPSANQAVNAMLAKDTSLKPLMDDAYGYIIFPSVASGALIVGGQGGDGVVFKNGAPWGLAKLASGSIGFQIGGESFTELVVIQTEDAFTAVTADKFSFTAGVNATAVKAGAALDAEFSNGITAFVSTNGGLMASAAIGGQQISCYPANVE